MPYSFRFAEATYLLRGVGLQILDQFLRFQVTKTARFSVTIHIGGAVLHEQLIYLLQTPRGPQKSTPHPQRQRTLPAATAAIAFDTVKQLTHYQLHDKPVLLGCC